MAEQSSREDIVLGVALTDAREGESVRVRLLGDSELGLRMDATPRQVCERIVQWIEVDTGEAEAWRGLMLIAVEAKAALDSPGDDPYDGIAHTALVDQTETAIGGLKRVLEMARQTRRPGEAPADTLKAIETHSKYVLDQLEDEDH